MTRTDLAKLLAELAAEIADIRAELVTPARHNLDAAGYWYDIANYYDRNGL